VPGLSAIRTVLDRIPIGIKGPYLLSTTQGERPISGFAKISNAFHDQSEIRNWGFHDLRRIVATELAGSRVPQELIERIKHVNDRLSWLAFKTRVHL
jgi:hypothetical protein